MRQQEKNIRSTKSTTKIEVPINNKVDDGIKTGECYFVITSIASTGKIFSDQTGRFPVTSSKGNKYVMIMYDYDSNIILEEATKSRTGDEVLRAFTRIYAELKGKGLGPKIHHLDNEFPEHLKRYTKEQQITYQLVPLHIHQRNTAEKAISTFKDHLIAGLASVSSKMPMHLWYRLLPQSLLTINLLRQSRIHPTLFAYAQLNGQHDYNGNPISPP